MEGNGLKKKKTKPKKPKAKAKTPKKLTILEKAKRMYNKQNRDKYKQTKHQEMEKKKEMNKIEEEKKRIERLSGPHESFKLNKIPESSPPSIAALPIAALPKPKAKPKTKLWTAEEPSSPLEGVENEPGVKKRGRPAGGKNMSKEDKILIELEKAQERNSRLKHPKSREEVKETFYKNLESKLQSISSTAIMLPRANSGDTIDKIFKQLEEAEKAKAEKTIGKFVVKHKEQKAKKTLQEEPSEESPKLERKRSKGKEGPPPPIIFLSAEPKSIEVKPKKKITKPPPPPSLPPRPPPSLPPRPPLQPVSEPKEKVKPKVHSPHSPEYYEPPESPTPSHYAEHNSGEGINFNKIHWGSLTEEMKHHPEFKSVETFAHHILKNPNHFSKKTKKRANFYVNVLEGKGFDSDSDSDSDSSSDEIISHYNKMRHPALKSSTITLNPGAYNNIKPLMGHLMHGGAITPITHSMDMSHMGDYQPTLAVMPPHWNRHSASIGKLVGGDLKGLLHHGMQFLTNRYGSQVGNLLGEHLNKHISEFHPEHQEMIHQGLRSALHSLGKETGIHTDAIMHGLAEHNPHLVGGSFWDSLVSGARDLGNQIKSGAEDVGNQIKSGAENVVEKAKDLGNEGIEKTKNLYTSKIAPEIPGIVHKANLALNDRRTQMGMAGLTSALNYAGMPYVGVPLSLAYYGARQGADAYDNHRTPAGQFDNQYLEKPNKYLGTNFSLKKATGYGLKEDIKAEVDKAEQKAKNFKGGEIGDGLYAQGRGFKKGSPEMKAHMAKIRAMRGKKMTGGAIPEPPSRIPITNPVIGGGLYA